MRKFLLLVISVFSLATVYAQQDPLYSQYINNPLVLNPAYAGLTNNLNLSLNYRSQWAGYEGSPKTLNANGHTSLVKNKMGLGLMAISDKIGNLKTSEVVAVYSYHINVTSDKILSFGLQGGMSSYKIDNSKVTPYDTSDPLFQGNMNEMKPTLGFGVILKNDKFFVSASVPRMLKSTVNILGENTSLHTQHVYLMGSYIFFLSERIRLKPAALLKMVSGAPASVDLNASLIVFENYQVGLLTRDFHTNGLFMQALLKDKFRVGYVIEVPTSSSVGTRFLTHELTLGFRMNVLSFHNNSGVLSF